MARRSEISSYNYMNYSVFRNFVKIDPPPSSGMPIRRHKRLPAAFGPLPSPVRWRKKTPRVAVVCPCESAAEAFPLIEFRTPFQKLQRDRHVLSCVREFYREAAEDAEHPGGRTTKGQFAGCDFDPDLDPDLDFDGIKGPVASCRKTSFFVLVRVLKPRSCGVAGLVIVIDGLFCAPRPSPGRPPAAERVPLRDDRAPHRGAQRPGAGGRQTWLGRTTLKHRKSKNRGVNFSPGVHLGVHRLPHRSRAPSPAAASTYSVAHFRRLGIHGTTQVCYRGSGTRLVNASIAMDDNVPLQQPEDGLGEEDKAAGRPAVSDAAPQAADSGRLPRLVLWLGLLAAPTLGLTAGPALLLGVAAAVLSVREQRSAGRGLIVAGMLAAVIALVFVVTPLGLLVAGRTALDRLIGGGERPQDRGCAENLHAIGVACWVYAQREGRLPPADRWQEALASYLGDPRTFCCPAGRRGRCGYALNVALAGQDLFQVGDPERTVLAFDARGRGPNLSGGVEIADPRHRGGVMVVFCDAHTERVPRNVLGRLVWRPQLR